MKKIFTILFIFCVVVGAWAQCEIKPPYAYPHEHHVFEIHQDEVLTARANNPDIEIWMEVDQWNTIGINDPIDMVAGSNKIRIHNGGEQKIHTGSILTMGNFAAMVSGHMGDTIVLDQPVPVTQTYSGLTMLYSPVEGLQHGDTLRFMSKVVAHNTIPAQIHMMMDGCHEVVGTSHAPMGTGLYQGKHKYDFFLGTLNAGDTVVCWLEFIVNDSCILNNEWVYTAVIGANASNSQTIDYTYPAGDTLLSYLGMYEVTPIEIGIAQAENVEMEVDLQLQGVGSHEQRKRSDVQEGIRAWPNPARTTDRLQVEVQGFGWNQYHIIDMSGQRVSSGPWPETYGVSLEGFSPGVYTVQVMGSGKTTSTKVVVCE